MPRHKDVKRIIRTRMEKTGESYTAARAQVLQPGPQQGAPLEDASYAAPKKEWPALAGMADDKVKAKTGRTWAGWVNVLDDAIAFKWTHKDIAKWLREHHGDVVNGWWSQTITVGYERIRGIRVVGQSCEGTFETSKSRTFAIDVASLFSWFKDSRKRKRWLDGGWKRLRTSQDGRSLRVDWEDGSQANFWFDEKGPAKTTVTVQVTKLQSKDDIARAKAEWQAHFDALKATLAARG